MNGLPGNPVSDGSGNYSATVTYGWSGTVTPTKAGGWTFDPVNRIYANVTTDQLSQNYDSTPITPIISGNTETGGVTMNGLPGNPVSDGSGNYSATVTYGWSGTVTPTKAGGWTFDPVNRIYANVTTDQTAQDYIANPLSETYII